jgi:TRAP-type C4-dicarboxylate transport system permease small subunit
MILKIISKLPEMAVTLILIVLLIDMLMSTLFRYVFMHPLSWAEEIGSFGLIWMTMIGTGLAIKRNAHFIMPTFRFSPRVNYAVAFIIQALIISFGFLMIITGSELINYSLGTISPALEINMGYVNCSGVVGGILIVVYGVQRIRELIIGGLGSLREIH